LLLLLVQCAELHSHALRSCDAVTAWWQLKLSQGKQHIANLKW
jgi:hypothetical protein